MRKKERLKQVFDALFAEYGKLKCPLKHESAFQLLVAVQLSAQCTDARVNIVTAELFRRFPDAPSLAAAELGEVEELVKSCGLFRNKSRNIIAAARMIVSDFNGEVPETMDELTKLPGMGRKSANVILGDIFKKPGFPVDTHVGRLLRRIGLTESENPVVIEREITALLPGECWIDFSHLLITHGRRVCKAPKPDCRNCLLGELCRYGKKSLQ